MRPTAKSRSANRRPPAILCLPIGVALLALGCADSAPSGPGERPNLNLLPPGLTISDPIRPEGAAYVSAKPGTFPGAGSATVTNVGTGVSVAVDVHDGGFDPTPLAAEPEDEFELLVLQDEPPPTSYRRTVPSSFGPHIVRVHPEDGSVEVPTNTHIVVVFSEPVVRSTVDGSSFFLENELARAIVPSTVILPKPWVRAEFLPLEPLESMTRYRVVISSWDQIHDRSGERVWETYATFRTGPGPMAEPTEGVTFGARHLQSCVGAPCKR